MIEVLGELYVRIQILLFSAFGEFKEERGDTNLISIIIILGIVLALVVVFRGYITSILDKIKGSVDSFNNNAF